MLENQGGTGTALTHWEKRVFQVREKRHHAITKLYFDFGFTSGIHPALDVLNTG